MQLKSIQKPERGKVQIAESTYTVLVNTHMYILSSGVQGTEVPATGAGASAPLLTASRSTAHNPVPPPARRGSSPLGRSLSKLPASSPSAWLVGRQLASTRGLRKSGDGRSRLAAGSSSRGSAPGRLRLLLLLAAFKAFKATPLLRNAAVEFSVRLAPDKRPQDRICQHPPKRFHKIAILSTL